MEKKIMPEQEQRGAERPQVLFVDGCKVTVKYSEQKNPPVARTIKDALLASCISLNKC